MNNRFEKALCAMFVILVALFAVALATHMRGTPLDPRFGDSGAPYSDALLPWLSGALDIITGAGVAPHTYRPTSSIILASLLTLTSETTLIPWVMLGWLLTLFLTLYICGSRSLRNTLIPFLIATLSPVCMNFWFGNALPATLLLDFCALIITIFGVLLTVDNIAHKETKLLPLGVGLIATGMSMTIRGVLIIGAPLLALIAAYLCIKRRSLSAALLLLACCFTPFAADVLIQRSYNVVNNGMETLYCVTLPPTHSFTPACDLQYKQERPTAPAVLTAYLSFLSSPEGRARMFQYIGGRFALDLQPLTQPFFLLALLAAVVLSISAPPITRDTRRKRLFQTLPAVLFVGLVALMMRVPVISLTYGMGVGGALVALALLALQRGHVRTTLLLLIYVLSIFVIAAIGLPFVGRIAAASSWMLPFALLLSCVEEGTAQQERAATVTARHDWVLLPHMLAIAALYGGWLLPFGILERSWQQMVASSSPVALKISTSEPMNRSLFYTSTRVLYYTKHDNLPVGSLLVYSSIDAPHRSGNESFREPVHFIREANE
jgi:hypothetical protein